MNASAAPMWAGVLAFLQAVTGAAGFAQLVPYRAALFLVILTAGLQGATVAYQNAIMARALVALPPRPGTPAADAASSLGAEPPPPVSGPPAGR